MTKSLLAEVALALPATTPALAAETAPIKGMPGMAGPPAKSASVF